MLNITPDTGEFLSALVRFGAARVLEIGTSNGYSTLWLAEAAAAIDGHVITLEYAQDKAAMTPSRAVAWPIASRWFTTMQGRGWHRPSMPALTCCSSIRTAGSTPAGGRSCAAAAGGLLVVDNATACAGMEPLRVLLDADPDFSVSLVPVGNGELLAVRSA